MVHALDRVSGWVWDWSRTGRLVLLLDFDGTLSPIVARAEDAQLLAGNGVALNRLRRRSDVDIAVVSGRALADVSGRVGIQGLLYAGNHGMEIEGPDVHEIAPEAVELRPQLETARERIAAGLQGVRDVWIEDKVLTLTVHHRQADPADEPRIREVVGEVVEAEPRLHLTSGKKVLEVRPRIDYHKGTAVRFLLRHIDPPPGSPILYIGDDRTDEDAFRAVRDWAGGGGEGVLVADQPPADTAALSYLRDAEDVSSLLATLAVQEAMG
jgi:trehalose 6-phosphate phosphatase